MPSFIFEPDSPLHWYPMLHYTLQLLTRMIYNYMYKPAALCGFFLKKNSHLRVHAVLRSCVFSNAALVH